MASNLSSSIKKILISSLALNKKDTCLILTDKDNMNLGLEFYKIAKQISKAKLAIIPTAKVSGEEPSKEIAEMMKEFSVILITTTKSLSHTKARREATKKGARIASMPGITEDIIKRAFNADYKKIGAFGERLIKKLGNKLIVKTQNGTDLKLKFKTGFQNDAGIYSKSSEWGNLPAGEVFAYPMNSEGIIIIDSAISGIGKIKVPVAVKVKNNFAVSIEGKEDAKKLKEILNSINSKNAYNIAEFGIGTNNKAKLSGNVLEDEKALGTCHFAFGSNASIGGKVDVPLHIDCIISKPTIFSGKKKIIDKGKFYFKYSKSR